MALRRAHYLGTFAHSSRRRTVRNNDLSSVQAAVARDPQAVHTKVYPQAYERVSQQAAYRATSGRDSWEAAPHARALNGQTALHASGGIGGVGGAFELCRHGANPTLKDVEGRSARDLALAADAAGRDVVRRTLLYGPGEQADWVKPGGGETSACRRE